VRAPHADNLYIYSCGGRQLLVGKYEDKRLNEKNVTPGPPLCELGVRQTATH
jgi:hypothetical protein